MEMNLVQLGTFVFACYVTGYYNFSIFQGCI